MRLRYANKQILFSALILFGTFFCGILSVESIKVLWSDSTSIVFTSDDQKVASTAYISEQHYNDAVKVEDAGNGREEAETLIKEHHVCLPYKSFTLGEELRNELAKELNSFLGEGSSVTIYDHGHHMINIADMKSLSFNDDNDDWSIDGNVDYILNMTSHICKTLLYLSSKKETYGALNFKSIFMTPSNWDTVLVNVEKIATLHEHEDQFFFTLDKIPKYRKRYFGLPNIDKSKSPVSVDEKTDVQRLGYLMLRLLGDTDTLDKRLYNHWKVEIYDDEKWFNIRHCSRLQFHPNSRFFEGAMATPIVLTQLKYLAIICISFNKEIRPTVKQVQEFLELVKTNETEATQMMLEWNWLLGKHLVGDKEKKRDAMTFCMDQNRYKKEWNENRDHARNMANSLWTILSYKKPREIIGFDKVMEFYQKKWSESKEPATGAQMPGSNGPDDTEECGGYRAGKCGGER